MSTDWIVPGRRVCILGHGTSAGVHEHRTIERLTKTLIVMDNTRRFRIEPPHDSVPQRDWSWFSIYPTCQRKEDKD